MPDPTEREQIVAWLRGMRRDWDKRGVLTYDKPWMLCLADAIERGDHLKESN